MAFRRKRSRSRSRTRSRRRGKAGRIKNPFRKRGGRRL